MKNKAFFTVFLLTIFGAVFYALPQFTPQEISQREYWEDFLKTADIMKSEAIGEGVTKPWRLYLKKGDVEKRAAWKNPSGMMQGFWEGWQYEIAAYRLDKLIGLNMIPPTVEREFNGKQGALSLWADSKFSLLGIQEQGIKIPDSVLEQVDKMKYITRLWACLIANDDVTQQNVLYTEDWRTILIDHSRSFRSSREFTEKLMYGAQGIKTTGDGRPILFRRIPRWLVEKIKALDFASIKQAVGPYLADKEAEAIIARKKLILDEIAEMIKQNGEDKILY